MAPYNPPSSVPSSERGREQAEPGRSARRSWRRWGTCWVGVQVRPHVSLDSVCGWRVRTCVCVCEGHAVGAGFVCICTGVCTCVQVCVTVYRCVQVCVSVDLYAGGCVSVSS